MRAAENQRPALPPTILLIPTHNKGAVLDLLEEQEAVESLRHSENVLQQTVGVRLVRQHLEHATVDVIVDSCLDSHSVAQSALLQPVARVLRRPLFHVWIPFH